MNGASRDTIRHRIARLRVRWWRVSLQRCALQSLFYLLLVGAVVALAFPSVGAGTLAVALAAGAALAATAAAALRRPSEVALAKDYDDAAGLADRVSSSIELAGQEGPMVDALREEAAAMVASLPPERVYPFRLPRESRWLPVPAVAVVAALVLPGWFAEQPQADTQFEQSLEQRLAALEELLSNEQNKELGARRKELLEELEKLKAELDKGQVDRKDTQAEIAKLLEQMRKERAEEQEKENELKKLLKSLQEDTGRKDLDPHIQNGDYQKALNELREKLEELKKELERKKKKGASPDELKDLEELIEKLKKIEAKLMQLLQLDIDMQFMGATIDFLCDWDGELGDLADLDPATILEPGEP